MLGFRKYKSRSSDVPICRRTNLFLDKQSWNNTVWFGGEKYADTYSTNHGGVMLRLLNNYIYIIIYKDARGGSDIQRWKRDKFSITEGWNQRGNPGTAIRISLWVHKSDEVMESLYIVLLRCAGSSCSFFPHSLFVMIQSSLKQESLHTGRHTVSPNGAKLGP